MIVLDSRGTIHRERDDLNPIKAELAGRTNRDDVMGGLAEALEGADVVVGLSSSKFDEAAFVKMNKDGIIFALSNPTRKSCAGCGQEVCGSGCHRTK